MTAPAQNNFALDAWAAWHPVKGFADPYTFEGPVAFADLDSCVERVKILNAEHRTTNRNGWRAIKVYVMRVPA